MSCSKPFPPELFLRNGLKLVHRTQKWKSAPVCSIDGSGRPSCVRMGTQRSCVWPLLEKVMGARTCRAWRKAACVLFHRAAGTSPLPAIRCETCTGAFRHPQREDPCSFRALRESRNALNWLCCLMPVRVGVDAQMNVAISSSGFFSIACCGMVASSFG